MAMQTQQAAVAAALEKQLSEAAKVIEEHLDTQIEQMDKMEEDDFEKLRHKRMAELKKLQQKKQEYLTKGHGTYQELAEQDFFKECKKSENIIIHFYRPSTDRSKILDMHLDRLAPKHVNCRFVKVNAEKAPFLAQRLGIHVLPSIAVFKDSVSADLIVGFEDLGMVDDFPTVILEWRLAQSGVIKYDGDLTTPPWQPDSKKSKGIFHTAKKRTKNIKGGQDEDDSSDDNNDW